MTSHQPQLTPTGCPVSHRAATFDFFQGPYQEDPAVSLAWARREEPVFYSPQLDYWIVTRYEDVKQIFKDTETFSARIALDQLVPLREEAVQILAHYGFNAGKSLANEDPPKHPVRRAAHQEPFKAKQVERLVPRIREVVTHCIDRFVRAGKADLVAGLFHEAPNTIALIFMGVPDEDIQVCRRFSMEQTIFTWGRPDLEEQKRVATGMGQYWQFAGGLVEKLKRTLTDDTPGWLPHLIRAQRRDPSLFSDNDLQTTAMSGLVAAHETTTNASGNALRALLEHREVWERICREPEAIPKAVEESLRYSSSVVSWRRQARKDTVIGGVRVPAGAKLLLMTASANHDDAVFDDPDAFDIDRDNANRHLSFGFGPHICMGATLARLEMRIFLEELTRRLPHMRLVEGQTFSYLPNTSFRGPRELWVEWDPAANPVPADRP
ncbi:cytochrome P450 [Streptomyces sp. 7-21]|uniref:cytochrome P450 n=1 Tax=Streptomyces sp. 7-21 TaxID=2802283 RepID=UPI00191E756B|nr:cytochrome P450 [Streptomyces sp. 7-21]MBL1067463.1 cytochrome P450 [Streptomyces sp. 7-21]